MEKLKSIYKERKKEVVIGAAIVLEILIVVLTIWALGNMKTPSNEGKQPVVVVQTRRMMKMR